MMRLDVIGEQKHAARAASHRHISAPASWAQVRRFLQTRNKVLRFNMNCGFKPGKSIQTLFAM
jgi:hypothetical protein